MNIKERNENIFTSKIKIKGNDLRRIFESKEFKNIKDIV